MSNSAEENGMLKSSDVQKSRHQKLQLHESLSDDAAAELLQSK